MARVTIRAKRGMSWPYGSGKQGYLVSVTGTGGYPIRVFVEDRDKAIALANKYRRDPRYDVQAGDMS